MTSRRLSDLAKRWAENFENSLDRFTFDDSSTFSFILLVGIRLQRNCNRTSRVRRSLAASGRSTWEYLPVLDEDGIGEAGSIESPRLLNSFLVCNQPTTTTQKQESSSFFRLILRAKKISSSDLIYAWTRERESSKNKIKSKSNRVDYLIQ